MVPLPLLECFGVMVVFGAHSGLNFWFFICLIYWYFYFFFPIFATFSKVTAKFRGPVAFGFQICFSISSVLATYSITPPKLEKKSY